MTPLTYLRRWTVVWKIWIMTTEKMTSLMASLCVWSLISVVSSVGEEDSYLSEPTYNNLDPLWARRHGFGPGLAVH